MGNLGLLLPLIFGFGLALTAEEAQISTIPDPKQVVFGVLMACFIMMVVLLLCVFVAYLSLQALQAF